MVHTASAMSTRQTVITGNVSELGPSSPEPGTSPDASSEPSKGSMIARKINGNRPRELFQQGVRAQRLAAAIDRCESCAARAVVALSLRATRVISYASHRIGGVKCTDEGTSRGALFAAVSMRFSTPIFSTHRLDFLTSKCLVPRNKTPHSSQNRRPGHAGLGLFCHVD